MNAMSANYVTVVNDDHKPIVAALAYDKYLDEW